MFGFLNPYVIGGAALVLVVTNGLSWNYGRTWEKNRSVAANAVATVEALKQSNSVQKRVGDLDAKGLCIELGGTWKDEICE